MLRTVFSRLFFVLLAGIALSGCELAEGIFKAGMAVAVAIRYAGRESKRFAIPTFRTMRA